jgi:hypothetical protein
MANVILKPDQLKLFQISLGTKILKINNGKNCCLYSHLGNNGLENMSMSQSI